MTVLDSISFLPEIVHYHYTPTVYLAKKKSNNNKPYRIINNCENNFLEPLVTLFNITVKLHIQQLFISWHKVHTMTLVGPSQNPHIFCGWTC